MRGGIALTDFDLEVICDNHGSTYRTRRSELVELGYVADSGQRRMQEGSNRIVWVITELGQRDGNDFCDSSVNRAEGDDMKLGEWRFLKKSDRSVGWASVLPTEDWRRADRLMGPIEWRTEKFTATTAAFFSTASLYVKPRKRGWSKSKVANTGCQSHAASSVTGAPREIEDWLWRQKNNG